jgi:EpsI family protein
MKPDKTFIVILILLAGVALFSVVLYFRHPSDSGSKKIADLPMQIGEWKGEDIAIEKRTYDILETKNVVMRKYVNSIGEIVYLFIVVSETNRRVAHPPEICYTGSGAEIIEKSQLQFSVPALKEPFTVNSFISREKGLDSLVFYWFKAGDKFTPSYLGQQTKAMLNQLAGKKASLALIRVSRDIINGDKEKARQILQEFSRELIPQLLNILY